METSAQPLLPTQPGAKGVGRPLRIPALNSSAAFAAAVFVANCVGAGGLHLEAQPASGETNPRVGTWKLNLSKSTFHDSPVPKTELQICDAIGQDTIRLRTVRVEANGNERKSEYIAHYDGKDYPFPGSLWDTIALKRLDRNTSEAVFKKAGAVVQTSTITVSKDGRVLTLEARASNAAGKPITHNEVFDRQ